MLACRRGALHLPPMSAALLPSCCYLPTVMPAAAAGTAAAPARSLTGKHTSTRAGRWQHSSRAPGSRTRMHNEAPTLCADRPSWARRRGRPHLSSRAAAVLSAPYSPFGLGVSDTYQHAAACLQALLIAWCHPTQAAWHCCVLHAQAAHFG